MEGITSHHSGSELTLFQCLLSAIIVMMYRDACERVQYEAVLRSTDGSILILYSDMPCKRERMQLSFSLRSRVNFSRVL